MFSIIISPKKANDNPSSKKHKNLEGCLNAIKRYNAAYKNQAHNSKETKNEESIHKKALEKATAYVGCFSGIREWWDGKENAANRKNDIIYFINEIRKHREHSSLEQDGKVTGCGFLSSHLPKNFELKKIHKNRPLQEYECSYNSDKWYTKLFCCFSASWFKERFQFYFISPDNLASSGKAKKTSESSTARKTSSVSNKISPTKHIPSQATSSSNSVMSFEEFKKRCAGIIAFQANPDSKVASIRALHNDIQFKIAKDIDKNEILVDKNSMTDNEIEQKKVENLTERMQEYSTYMAHVIQVAIESNKAL